MVQERKVQILLASYNGAQHISEQVESILAQDYPNFLLTIRDDGSKDETRQIIRSYAEQYPEKVSILEDGMNSSGSASGNFARLMDTVEGEYYMLCDQDDVWMIDKISRSMDAMLALEGLWGKQTPLLVFSDLEVADDRLKTLHRSFWKLRGLDPEMASDFEQLIANNVITGCTMLFNRKARDVSVPVPARRFLHDQWIGFHVAYYGKVSHIHQPTLFYRQHEKNEMGARKLTTDYFFRKIFFFPRLWSDWRWLKKQKTIPFRLRRVVWLKFKFNLSRLLYANSNHWNEGHSE